MSASNLAFSVRNTRSAFILADHRSVGRDGHDLQPVDLEELLLLGHRRTGHARQLVVEPEVVLEGDRGQGHRLALDTQALLGLDRLVETLRPASTGHLATRELVDDDDLAVLDDVVAVDLVQGVCPKRLLEMTGQPGIGGDVVDVRHVEELLDLLDALLRGRDRVLLEVDEVVAALLGAFRSLLQPRHQARERVVQVARFLRLAADDRAACAPRR